MSLSQRLHEVAFSEASRGYERAEVDQLLGNPAKAKRKLGWSHRIGFSQLVAEMMESDLQRVPRARQRYGPE